MLNDAIGGLLPSALAVALSRIPIVAIVLVLGAPNARMAGPALAVGWIAVLLSVSVNSDDPGLNWLNIAIGTLFLLMAAKQWTKRPNRYIRVSDASRRHGERFISPVEQREAIERWAAQRGFHLMEVLEELDESRARADRPLLERAVSRIEAGVSSGLVVTHVDRFGRSLLAGLQVIEAGRLACQILLSTADTSFRFRQAVREGIHHGRRIGQLAATRYLRPAHRRQTVAFKR